MTGQSEKSGGEITPKLPALSSHPWGRPQEACIEEIVLYPVERKLDRVILLNALVVPRKPMLIISVPVSLEEAKALVRMSESVASYVGHEGTAKLLSELFSTSVPVNRGEYTPRGGDVAIIARLKRRLQTPQDLQNISQEDLEFHVAVYEEMEVREYKPPTMLIHTLPATL